MSNKYLGKVALCGSPPNFNIYDIKKGKKLFTISDSSSTHYCGLYFHPGKMVVGIQTGLQIVNLRKKTVEVPKFGSHNQYIWSLTHLPNNCFASGGCDGMVKIFSLKKEKYSFPSFGNIRGLASLSTRDFSVCSGIQNQVKIFNIQKKKSDRDLSCSGQMYCLVEDPLNELLVGAGYTSYKGHFWDLRKPRKAAVETPSTSQYLWTVEVVPERKEAWFGSQNGNVLVYDLRKPSKMLNSLSHGTQTIYRIRRFDSSTMLSVGIDYNLQSWKINTKTKKYETIRNSTYLYDVVVCKPAQDIYISEIGESLSAETERKNLLMEMYWEYGESLSEKQILETIDSNEKHFNYMLKEHPYDTNVHLPNKMIRMWKSFFTQIPPEYLQKKEEKEEVVLPSSFKIDIEEDIVLSIVLSKENNLQIMKKRINERKLIDYFMFFRLLGMKGEMYFILKIVRMISDPLTLLLLFLDAIKRFESQEIKDLFTPKEKKKHSIMGNLERFIDEDQQQEEEIMMTRIQQQQERRKQQKMNKNDDKEKEEDPEEKNEEQENSDNLFSIPQILKPFSNNPHHIQRSTSPLYSPSFSLFGYSPVKEEEEEENETFEKKIENEMKKKRNAKCLKFKTSFCLLLFNILKNQIDEVSDTPSLIRPFMNFLEYFGDYSFQELFKHEDFKGLLKQEKEEEEDKDDEEKDVFSEYFGNSDDEKDELLNLTFSNMLKSKRFTNLQLICKDGTNFSAHREVLLLRSEFLFDLILEKNKEEKKNKIEISELNGIQMKYLLQFAYIGKIQLEEHIWKDEKERGEEMRSLLQLILQAFKKKDYLFVTELLHFLRLAFRRVNSKRKMKSFFITEGYILKGEEGLKKMLMNEMEQVDFEEEDVNERELEDWLEKSEENVKFHSILDKLENENNNLKKENQELKKKNDDLLQKLKILKKKE